MPPNVGSDYARYTSQPSSASEQMNFYSDNPSKSNEYSNDFYSDLYSVGGLAGSSSRNYDQMHGTNNSLDFLKPTSTSWLQGSELNPKSNNFSFALGDYSSAEVPNLSNVNLDQIKIVSFYTIFKEMRSNRPSF